MSHQVDFKSIKPLLQKGYTSSLRFSLTTEKGSTAGCFPGIVLEEILNSLDLPFSSSTAVYAQNKLFENFRGRQIQGDTSKEQLLKLSGEIDCGDNKTFPLELEVNTFFDSFKSGNNICYQQEAQTTEILKETLPELSIRSAFRLFPVVWHQAKFGIEFFRKSFFGSMVGSAPTIFKRLYIDLDKNKLEIFAEESFLTKKDLLPLSSENLLKAIELSTWKFGVSIDEILEKLGSVALLSRD